MLIHKENHIEIYYPENWEECYQWGFRESPYSRYGQSLFVVDTQTDWGYSLKSEYAEDEEGIKRWEYRVFKRNDPYFTFCDVHKTCYEINERIGMDIWDFIDFPLRMLRKKLEEGYQDANLYKMLGDACKKQSAFQDAIHHYTVAAHQGDVEAMYELAELYADRDSEFYRMEEALKWYQEASNRGHEPSMYALGAYYYENGVKNMKKALTTLEQLNFDYPNCEFGICLDERYDNKHIDFNTAIYLQDLYYFFKNNRMEKYYDKIIQEY